MVPHEHNQGPAGGDAFPFGPGLFHGRLGAEKRLIGFTNAVKPSGGIGVGNISHIDFGNVRHTKGGVTVGHHVRFSEHVAGIHGGYSSRYLSCY